MSTKSPKFIPGQKPLFSGDFTSNKPPMTWQEHEESPTLVAYYDAIAEGVPMVDLLDRATRISAALTEMGRMSSVNVGFLTATHTPRVEEIDRLYGRRVTSIVERNARNKLPEREQRVKDLLGPATGSAAMRAANPRLMPIEEINARARHTWERFSSRFTGPDNAERREEYRRMLSKQITTQKKLRKRLGIPIPKDDIK